MNKMAADNIELGDVVATRHDDAHTAPGHSIARMREEGGSPAPIDCERKRLIHREESVRQQSDAFRGIRTRLLEMAGENNFVTLVVSVSPRSGEVSSHATLRQPSLSTSRRPACWSIATFAIRTSTKPLAWNRARVG